MRPEGYKQAPLFISDNGASKGVSRVLLTEHQINARVKELGQILTTDYSEREVVFLAVLKGALYFLVDLIRNVDLPLTVGVTSIETWGLKSHLCSLLGMVWTTRNITGTYLLLEL